MMIVFVYGTLKRGGSNHAFLAGQNFIGEARTAPGYTLYSLGDFPGMVPSPDDRAGVTGELWSVDAACLAELDRLEGLDEGLYARAEVSLTPNPHAATAHTYLYLRPLIGRPQSGPTWPVGNL